MNSEKERKSLFSKIKKTKIFRYFNTIIKIKKCLKNPVSDNNFVDFTDIGMKLYNKGNYESALIIFKKLSDHNRTFLTSLLPQMEKCKNVVTKSKENGEKTPSKILKIVRLQNLIRCKYCGHYTKYIDPNEPTYGFASTNNCSKCGRMYFAPNFYWDSWDGMEYIQERHSVSDEEFYEEYEFLKNKEKELAKGFNS